jgi:exonuclease SbcC
MRATAEAADAATRAADGAIRAREKAVAEGLRWAEARATVEARIASRRAEVEGHRGRLAEEESAVRDAEAALAAADEADRQAHVGHEAAHLREGLVVGAPCPVCLQHVTAVPDAPEVASLSVAAAALKVAKAAHKQAETTENATRAALQAAERMLAEDQAALSAFADVPAIDAARAEYARVRTELEGATAARVAAEAALRAAVEEHGRLAAGLAGARAQLSGHEAAAAEARDRMAAAERTLSQGFPDGVPGDAGAAIAARLAACREARDRKDAARKDADVARKKREAADKARRALAAESSQLLQGCAGQRAVLAGIARRVDAGPLDVLAAGAAIGDEIAHLLLWASSAAEVLAAHMRTLDAERVAREGAFDAVLSAAGLGPRPDTVDRGLAALRKAARAASDDAVRAEAQLAAVRQKLADRQRLEEGIAADRVRQQLYAALATELRRDRFLDFLLSESVDRLAAIASDELRRISNDRYSLQSEETSFVVIDHANADETRSVETLSGGETFLASLSLATALARSITDIAGEAVGSRLEAMFIDEGFGTLDDESLDAVIDALERLREADRWSASSPTWPSSPSASPRASGSSGAAAAASSAGAMLVTRWR